MNLPKTKCFYFVIKSVYVLFGAVLPLRGGSMWHHGWKKVFSQFWSWRCRKTEIYTYSALITFSDNINY